MQIELLPNGLVVLVDAQTFSEATLHKCFYWYTRDYQVTIQPGADHHTQVQLVAKDQVVVDPATLQHQVHNDLLDFRLRELIAEETRPIRELLVAKAFAHYAPPQPLTAPISDPVGFHPLAPAP